MRRNGPWAIPLSQKRRRSGSGRHREGSDRMVATHTDMGMAGRHAKQESAERKSGPPDPAPDGHGPRRGDFLRVPHFAIYETLVMELQKMCPGEA